MPRMRLSYAHAPNSLLLSTLTALAACGGGGGSGGDAAESFEDSVAALQAGKVSEFTLMLHNFRCQAAAAAP
jgi:hypothetical protein